MLLIYKQMLCMKIMPQLKVKWLKSDGGTLLDKITSIKFNIGMHLVTLYYGSDLVKCLLKHI